MSSTLTVTCLPDSPESLSPSPSSHSANWSSLLKPLSAFPTPPDSIDTDPWDTEVDCVTISKKVTLAPTSWQTPTITASANFLSSFLPSSCKAPKCIGTIPESLHRGQHLFSPYTVAMAGCILDALSSKFCHTLLQHPTIPSTRQMSNFKSTSNNGNIAELIISTALLIATKFLNDRPPHNIHFATQVFDGAFSVDALTVTERLVLEDVNYRLGYLCAEGVVGEKMGRLEKSIEEEKSKVLNGTTGLEELEFELDFDTTLEIIDNDDIVDESRMLAAFEIDEDFDYDDEDD
ncbi:hypothetical protein H072_318 [Dactylellina haptotyla CBS 200.50]|uniref:Cyclin N-terminal domain-containing protein n=1 Tax=Dactylellina haptotyla (strain CBS 200.50) TaxID=1284197 RepID=S8C1R4_DACHA|nr:hypothetical protein H072_318 [Dactylellina haptotyla CBS 200.50]